MFKGVNRFEINAKMLKLKSGKIKNNTKQAGIQIQRIKKPIERSAGSFML
jgi:hypothetical protein